MIDIMKLIADYTIIFALIFVLFFIFIRFWLWPKFRDSGKKVEEENKEMFK